MRNMGQFFLVAVANRVKGARTSLLIAMTLSMGRDTVV